MITEKQEKLIIKQLEAVNREFKVLTGNMIILKDYFDKLIESYKSGECFDD